MLNTEPILVVNLLTAIQLSKNVGAGMEVHVSIKFSKNTAL
jgi:hypothetical protein